VILVCVALDLAIVGAHRLTHAIVLEDDIKITPVLLSLSWLLPMNVLLLVFNLVPAFPLDGGRIARALVWRVTGDKIRGTRVAAKLGRGFSVILAGFGLWLALASAGVLDDLASGHTRHAELLVVWPLDVPPTKRNDTHRITSGQRPFAATGGGS